MRYAAKTLTATLALSASLLVTGLPASAELSSADAEKFGDWVVRCSDHAGLPPCDMAQAVADRETGAQVMQFSIAYAGKEDTYGVLIKAPLGVFLPAGAAIIVDGEYAKKDIEFARCDQDGCYVENVMHADDMTAFKAEVAGALVMVSADGDLITLPLSFVGFREALDVMSERNRIWALDS